MRENKESGKTSPTESVDVDRQWPADPADAKRINEILFWAPAYHPATGLERQSK